MSAIIATPIIDEGMPRFIDDDAVPKDATRWLFFPGDVLQPRRKRELREMTGFGIRTPDGADFPLYSGGGEEINSVCLLRTKGVLPRAMFTPLEMAAVWTPQDLIPEGTQTFRGFATPNARWAEVLPGIKTYPGEAIAAILTAARNDQGNSKGAVELEALRQVTWDELTREGLQYLFFPTWPKLPPTLRELEALIQTGRNATSFRDLQLIGDEMLSACDQFRLWAMERIKCEETLVAVGTTEDGWTYRLSDVGEQLMRQLEITPQSQALLTATQLQAQLNQSIGEFVQKQAGKQDVPVTDILEKLQANQVLIADTLNALFERLTTPTGQTETPKVPKKN